MSLILDKQSNRKKYQLLQVDIDQDTIDQYLLTNAEELPLLRVTSLKFAIEHRSTTFKKYFNILKIAFVLTSLVVLWKYTQTLQQFERGDLGVVQKWIQALIVLLVCFDDPMCLFQDLFGWLYYMCQGFCESLFIAMLLLFWLIIMHSMSTNSQDGQIDISPDKFFIPKIALCVAYLLQLVTMRVYVYV